MAVLKTSLGWKRTLLRCSMRRGTTGTLRVVMQLTEVDGSPLASYEGFTAAIAFCRNHRTVPEISLELEVVGLPDDQLVSIDMPITSEQSAAIAEGVLRGDLIVIDPAGQRRCPLDIELTIERNFTP
jgi:hypothetical protein